MDYIFPTAVNRPKALLPLLGSIHSSNFDWIDFAEAQTNIQQITASNREHKLLQNGMAAFRKEIPTSCNEDLYCIILNQSEGVVSTNGFSFTAPTDLVTVPCIANGIMKPTITLSEGVDYYCEDGCIIFRTDPFITFTSEPVFTSGAVSDRRLYLWLLCPVFDHHLVQSHLSYLFGKHRDSENWKDILNILLDGLVAGSSRSLLEQVVGKIYDISLTETADEIVEEIYSDFSYQWVITNNKAYKHSLSATIIVEVGQVLAKNSPMSNGYSWIWPNTTLDANAPDLILSTDALSGAFTDSIIIENTIYPLTVTGTAISFPLVGEAEDVTLFWELVREREYESGTTIYDYFINHGGVPANVNPMLFFLQHVFANRAVVIWREKG